MPEDWFELLNSKVFFWLDVRRLNRQRLACGSVATSRTRRQRVAPLDEVQRFGHGHSD
jgi:hypothetical protein